MSAPGGPQGHDSIILSEEQRAILDQVKQGANVFFTGPAGTGKSVLLREIVKHLYGKYNDPENQVAITASTGIAALNIGGRTLHSWAGIILGKGSQENLLQRVLSKKTSTGRWITTKVLIIDEISMIDGELFDKLDFIGRNVREKMLLPFGGIQLIISGDFCQLPPVPEKTYSGTKESRFAFEADSWSASIGEPKFLTRVFRQRDQAFVELLYAIRFGTLSEAQVEKLYALSRELVYEDSIEPSHLFPLRGEVRDHNEKRLAELESEAMTYKAMDRAGWDIHWNPIPASSAVRLLEAQVIALDEVTLKIGAQVMLIQNVSRELVNGSCGKVTAYMSVREARNRSEDFPIASPKQVADTFDEKLNPDEKTRYDLRAINKNVFSPMQKWPLVQFSNGHELLCAPLEFTVFGFRGHMEAQRVRFPLILSWALSIHKSQGQTLERVYIDLENTFASGQAYVALSRATRMEHLQMKNFHPSKIMVDPRVVAWQTRWFGPILTQQPKDPLEDDDSDEFDDVYAASFDGIDSRQLSDLLDKHGA